MKGVIKWYSADPSTGEFQYDISERDFDTDKQSMRDTIVHLLCTDWEMFGEDGDAIIIVGEDEEEE